MVEHDRLARNLERVEEGIKAACARAGRPREAVRLVAVTKTVPASVVMALYGLGLRDFGENRCQVGVPKAAALSLPEARWHFIGHLQRNKVKQVVRQFRTLHSVDRERLVAELARVADERELCLDVLLEVKTSADENKHGVSPQALVPLAEAVLQTSTLRLRGLMTMAPLGGEEVTRPCFAALRELSVSLAARLGTELPELSMGMSNDFQIAVEEGATVVRVGSALFAGVEHD